MYIIDGNSNRMVLDQIGFSNILDVCFKCADYFTLSRSEWRNGIDKSLEEELEPYFVKTFKTPIWYGYDYTKAPEGCYREISVLLYKADEMAKEILLRLFTNIFLKEYDAIDPSIDEITIDLRDCTKRQEVLPSLENICFFSKQKMFAGTVSHEYMLGIVPITRALENIVTESDRWEVVDDCIIQLDKT